MFQNRMRGQDRGVGFYHKLWQSEGRGQTNTLVFLCPNLVCRRSKIILKIHRKFPIRGDEKRLTIRLDSVVQTTTLSQHVYFGDLRIRCELTNVLSLMIQNSEKSLIVGKDSSVYRKNYSN